MRRFHASCLCTLMLATGIAHAQSAATRDLDLEESSRRLESWSVNDRLAAVEELFAWALSTDRAGAATMLLERASGDRSRVVAAQAAHALRVLSARRPEYEGDPLAEHERVAARGRRDAAQQRDLEVWRERLAHGDSASRLQAVRALAAHARVVTDRAEVLALLELSTEDRSLAVAAQARAALDRLAQAGIHPAPVP